MSGQQQARRAARAMARVTPQALAAAPVPSEAAPPLVWRTLDDREAATVDVHLASTLVVGPTASGFALDGPRRVVEYPGEAFSTRDERGQLRPAVDTSDDSFAAMRAELAAPKHYGPDQTLAAYLRNDEGEFCQVILRGSLAALRQVIPDAATLAAWRAAGLVALPVPAGVGDDGAPAFRFVEVTAGIKPLQVEHEARGLERAIATAERAQAAAGEGSPL